MNSTEDSNGTRQPRRISPVEASAFPKRFYAAVRVEAVVGAFVLQLDGRSARTPGRKPLAVPTRPLAEALVGEWEHVGERIDPRCMPLTRLVNTVIDGVSQRQLEVMAEVLRFAASDLLAYRAGEPDALVQTQRAAWNPVLDWAYATYGARLTLTEGVMHVRQSEEALRRLQVGLDGLVGTGPAAPYKVGALHVMTTLTGSALLAAAVAANRLTVEQAWAAAHVDEDHQISLWGEDRDASARRAVQRDEMIVASQLYRLVLLPDDGA